MSVVLAVGAHPDDVELGCGATLARHVATGDEVYIFALGGGRNDEQASGRRRAIAALGAPSCNAIEAHLELEDQKFDAVPILWLIEPIESVIESFSPAVIYTHSSADLNVDHTLTHRAVLTAVRPLPGRCVKRVLAFEVPSATECGLRAFAPNVFVDVSGEPFLRKLRALECYAGEMRPFPHPRSEDAVTALAKWRGASVGVAEAEAFELVREVI